MPTSDTHSAGERTNTMTLGTSFGERAGFSLVELLTVVAILSVLALAVLPGFQSLTSFIRVQEARERTIGATKEFFRRSQLREFGRLTLHFRRDHMLAISTGPAYKNMPPAAAIWNSDGSACADGEEEFEVLAHSEMSVWKFGASSEHDSIEQLEQKHPGDIVCLDARATDGTRREVDFDAYDSDHFTTVYLMSYDQGGPEPATVVATANDLELTYGIVVSGNVDYRSGDSLIEGPVEIELSFIGQDPPETVVFEI